MACAYAAFIVSNPIRALTNMNKIVSLGESPFVVREVIYTWVSNSKVNRPA